MSTLNVQKLMKTGDANLLLSVHELKSTYELHCETAS